MNYQNERVDEIIDSARYMSDFEKAKPLWFELQEILHADQPYTMLYEPRGLVALHKRFQNVRVNALRAPTPTSTSGGSPRTSGASSRTRPAPPVRAYVFRRLLFGLLIIWGVYTLTFFAVNLAPGDPFANLENPKMQKEDLDRLRQEVGLRQAGPRALPPPDSARCSGPTARRSSTEADGIAFEVSARRRRKRDPRPGAGAAR